MDRLVKGFAFDGQVRLIGIEATDLVQTALDIKEVVETNLMEDAVENGAVQAEGNTFTFTIKPYEIKTFRIR